MFIRCNSLTLKIFPGIYFNSKFLLRLFGSSSHLTESKFNVRKRSSNLRKMFYNESFLFSESHCFSFSIIIIHFYFHFSIFISQKQFICFPLAVWVHDICADFIYMQMHRHSYIIAINSVFFLFAFLQFHCENMLEFVCGSISFVLLGLIPFSHSVFSC